MRDYYLSDEKLKAIRENDNPYVLKLRQAHAHSILEEEKALTLKGKWNAEIFKNQNPIDIEIGTGNGFFFAHQSFQSPDRNLLGFEIKYKCAYQTIRRTDALGLANAKVVRFHATLLDTIFETNELNNVYIFFPDPWPKKKHHKNRLIQEDLLKNLYNRQKPGSFLEFKTDNVEYFNWTVDRIKKSPYEVTRLTYDLHNSEWNPENFQTHFEKLWTRKGLKTMLIRAQKSNS